ncbi:MAG: Nramp family divalent metal transporter [Sulfolobales archaeon]
MAKETKEYFRLGEGPALEVVEKLPTPEEVFKVPKLSGWKLFATILGPSFMALGGALGSGEWIMGPSIAARYGLYLFWLVWVGVVLQTVYNIAFARITVLIGEPALVYMARSKPRWFWIPFLAFVLFAAAAWPGWASGAATALAVFILGRLPGTGDIQLVTILGAILFLICVLVVSVGGKIASTLEAVFRFKVLVVTFVVFLLSLVVARPEIWGELATGFVSIGYMPKGIDVYLLGGWWGYIGWASAINYLLTNYYRDKGYGMGHLVGYIPAMIGGKKIELSAVGKVFKLTPENLATWKRWEKLVIYDQWLIYATFGVVGMTLPSVMVRSVVPLGTTLPAWAIAAHTANQFGAMWGPVGFYLITFIGLITLWGTQLQWVDMLTRNMTDLLWSTSEGVRKWAKGDVRRVYYTFLVVYVAFAIYVFGAYIATGTAPLIILLLSANIANFGGFFAWYLLWDIDRKLPKELRMKWYYWPPIILFCIMCCFFFIVMVLGQLGIRIL